jgi:hypothetical protein
VSQAYLHGLAPKASIQALVSIAVEEKSILELGEHG